MRHFIVAGLIASLVIGGCGPRKPDLLTKPTETEQVLTSVLDAVDKSDAGKLLALDSPDEVSAEGLDANSLTKLLQVFHRETDGATHGPLVIEGSQDFLSASVIYSKNGHPLTTLLLVATTRPLPGKTSSGKAWASQLAYDLLIGAAFAEKHIDPNLRGVDVQKAWVSGVQDLRGELASGGPPRYCTTPRKLEFQTYDEVIETFNRRIDRMLVAAPK